MTTKSRARGRDYTRPCQIWPVLMSRGLPILKRQPGSPSSPPRGASEPIVRKLNQAAFATADTPSVQERLNVLAGGKRRDSASHLMVSRGQLQLMCGHGKHASPWLESASVKPVRPRTSIRFPGGYPGERTFRGRVDVRVSSGNEPI